MTHKDNTVPRWRARTFYTFAAMTALMLMAAAPNVLAPWLPIHLNPAIENPDQARWFNAVEGSGDVTVLILLVALLLRARSLPLVIASSAIGMLVTDPLVLPFTGPMMLVILLPMVLVVATYPHWRLIRAWRPRDVRVVRPVLVISILALAALAAPVGLALQHQITGSGNLVEANEWATYAEHLSSLAIGGLFIATGLPGWRLMAWLAGFRWLYLGTVAVMLPDQPSSWGFTGGLAALLVGAVFTVTAAGRRDTEAQEPATAPEPLRVSAAV